MSKTLPSRWFILFCVAAAALITVIVAAGWLAGDIAQTRLIPFSAPMHINTALCILVLSAALLSLSCERYGTMSALSCLALVVGLLTAIRAISDQMPDLNNLLVPYLPLTDPARAPRMAPSTVAAVLLMGSAFLLCQPAPQVKTGRLICATIIASIVVALGLVPLLGASLNLHSVPIWGHFTAMALHTALCFLLLGCGFIVYVRQVSQSYYWLPAPILVGLVTVTLLISSAVHVQENLKFQALLASEAEHIADKLDLQLHAVYGALNRMTLRWDDASGLPFDLWEKDADAYLADFPALTALSITDRTTRIIASAPKLGNQQVVGYQLDGEPLRAKAIRRLLATHEPQSTPVLALRIGKKGFLYITEMRVGNEFSGLQIGAVEIEHLFKENMGDDESRNFAVTIRENGAIIYQNRPGNPLPSGQWQSNSSFQNRSYAWTIAVEPTPSFLAARDVFASTAVLLVGLVTALLVSLCVFLAIRSRTNLQMLQQSEALNNAMLANAGSLIIATNTQGMVIGFNRAAEQALGFRAAEVIGKHSPALWHDRAEVMRRAVELSRETGTEVEPGFDVFVLKPRQEETETREWTFIAQDGRRFPVSLTATPLRDAKGAITGYMGVAQDITRQHQQQEALRTSEETLRAAMDNAAVGMALVDLTGKWLRVNDAVCRLLGYEHDDLLTMDVLRVTHPDDVASSRQHIDQLLQGDVKSYVIEKRYFHSSGRVIWVQLSVSLVRKPDGSPNFMIAQIQDVTGRKEVEQMKEDFVSVVSHELRTPLTSIRGSLGLIAGALAKDLPPQVSRLVDIAHKNAERLILLINDILDMDKIAAGKMRFEMRQEALRPLLEQAVEATTGYAAKFNVGITLAPIPTELVITVDADRLLQAMANLLSNAAKFSPAYSAVMVSVTRRDDHVRIAVRDNGLGIPAEFHSAIFGKFVQADSSVRREKGGTGLGLHITQQIIQHMGGQIGFDTVVGKGTEFWLDFPLVGATASAPGSTLRPEPKPASEREPVPAHGRILICEDDADVIEILRQQIGRAGFAVDIARSIGEARHRLAVASYTAMTLDLMFPGEYGMDFVRELRARPATLRMPIVIVSARADEEKKALQGNAFGVVDWLMKPIDEGRLMTALRQTVDAQPGIRPRLLHVEDDEDLSRVLAAAMDGQVEVINATTLRDAQEWLRREQFSLIVLDIGLPDGNGCSLLGHIGDYTEAPIPVLILSADEMPVNIHQSVAGTMVKSRMSETKIVETILSLIPRPAELPHA